VSSDRLYGGETLNARRRDQRDRVVAAARAVFAANGYASASIDEIVARARVSRTSFYRFFANKEECMLALFEEAMSDLAAAFARAAAAETPEERIRLGVEGIVAALGSDPETARVVLIEAVGATPEVERARSEARRHFAGLLAAEMQRYDGWRDRPTSEVELTSLALIAGLAEAVADLVAGQRAGDWRDLVPPLTRFAIRALSPEAAAAARAPEGAAAARAVPPAGTRETGM
jgi:AcrR family transcriptional regulator